MTILSLSESKKRESESKILNGRSMCQGRVDYKFLVSGRDLACQQEVSLPLTKTPPIHYSNMEDSTFSNYQGSYVFKAPEHRISRDASVRKRNLCTWQTPRNEFGFLDWNNYFHKGCNYSNETNEMM